MTTTGPLRVDLHIGKEQARTVHRPFFTAAILSVLTVGASWGVLILWRIGFAERFTGVSIHEINAHGYAQITGWVGLFIMGFGYQGLPRIMRTKLVAPRLAMAVFGVTLAGLLLATTGLGVAGRGTTATWTIILAVLGHALTLAATVTFAVQLAITYRRSGRVVRPGFVGFVGSALVWLVGQAAFALWHTWMTMTAGSHEEMLWYIATYQAPLRDLQIHGLGLLMILGLSSHLLPQLFGVARTSNRRVWTALVLINLAIVGEVVVFVWYRWVDDHRVAALLMVPWLMLAVGTAIMVWPWRLWRRLPRADHRSGKFIRAAYGWLAVSLVMLPLMPMYQMVSGIPFSHAYYGAIRHAITVGFISLMIMGVSARVVPTLRGIPPRSLGSLMGPFLLVNTGCLLRVSLQTLTDWHPVFFAVVGVSGLFELTGLAWWGAEMLRLMHRPVVHGRDRSGALVVARPPMASAAL
ncbi:hypothetical protein GCM10027290_12070 [Micromonospora sonneratiae]|uniref:NnrS family protein n=1 Tax=Micromonospora sonneratiae TaxID=1184706 RepID=A0ABW3YE14_9ACTN